jgi:hypothetical protein
MAWQLPGSLPGEFWPTNVRERPCLPCLSSLTSLMPRAIRRCPAWRNSASVTARPDGRRFEGWLQSGNPEIRYKWARIAVGLA